MQVGVGRGRAAQPGQGSQAAGQPLRQEGGAGPPRQGNGGRGEPALAGGERPRAGNGASRRPCAEPESAGQAPPDPAGGLALVLSGGGARGAYQAGVLQGIADLGLGVERNPYAYILGSSAGGIHGAALAAWADQPAQARAELLRIWSQVRPEQVFRTDLPALARNALRWLRDLSLGGALGGVRPKALLDTAPLRDLLGQIPLARIPAHLEAGALQALGVAATHYETAEALLFLHARPGTPRRGEGPFRIQPGPITLDHVMASSAIPLLFPTVQIGPRHFGDGCIQRGTPVAPALQLGADRILTIEVREPWARRAALHGPPSPAPCPAAILGVLLDALMLGPSEPAPRTAHDKPQAGPTPGPHEPVRILSIEPSASLASLACRHRHRIPWAVRHLLEGLGRGPAAAELASYLLFDQDYCRALLDLGRADARARARELERLFHPGESDRDRQSSRPHQ